MQVGDKMLCISRGAKSIQSLSEYEITKVTTCKMFAKRIGTDYRSEQFSLNGESSCYLLFPDNSEGLTQIVHIIRKNMLTNEARKRLDGFTNKELEEFVYGSSELNN